MLDSIQQTFASNSSVGVGEAFWRLFAALLLGIAVAIIYRLTRGPRAQRSLLATLVMLSVLLSITTLVIGDNIARAFSIVGALSIVRFRTVVNDTRDTAFVIFAVAVGMAAGAGYTAVPLLSLPFVWCAAWICTPFQSGAPAKKLAYKATLRLSREHAQSTRVAEALTAQTKRCVLRGVTSAKGDASSVRVYAIRLESEAALLPLIESLQSLEGVQGVEVKRD